jgi:hypothetical protein
VDAATKVYVADSVNDTIRRLSPVGTNRVVTTIVGQAQIGGSSDGTGANALFYLPEGIALDKTGNPYVADMYNNTVRLGQIVSGPALQITLAGSQVVLSWPNTGSYTLQTPEKQDAQPVDNQRNGLVLFLESLPPAGRGWSANKKLSTSSWIGYGGTATTANGTNSVTIAPPADHLFFRLANP